MCVCTCMYSTVCLYIYVCLHIHVSIHTHSYIQIYTWTCQSMLVYKNTYNCVTYLELYRIYMCILTCIVCVGVCGYMNLPIHQAQYGIWHVCVWLYVCIHTHVYIHTLKYKHPHTYKYISQPANQHCHTAPDNLAGWRACIQQALPFYYTPTDPLYSKILAPPTYVCICIYIHVCVWERETVRSTGLTFLPLRQLICFTRKFQLRLYVCVYVYIHICVFVCVREREWSVFNRSRLTSLRQLICFTRKFRLRLHICVYVYIHMFVCVCVW